MDLNMPIMDGYESTYHIRQYLMEQNLEQPIIVAITGHTEDSYVSKAISYGMN
jgi:CheY-like chemotaxis protein